jgi:WD repeat-containing protein 76
MRHSLKLFSADGDLLADLKDKEKWVLKTLLMLCMLIRCPHRITAVQAVTATHPAVVGRAASGNASGRCILWSTDDA